MTDFPQDHWQDHWHAVRASAPQDWVVAAATALVALVLLGVVPGLLW